MFCHKCGAQVAEEATFCHKCGTKVVNIGTGPSGDTSVTFGQEEKSDTKGPQQETLTASAQLTMRAKDTLHYATDDFKAFVDGRVRQTTKFRSAEELLDSHMPQKFMWLCFGIPAIIGLTAGGPLGALLFGLFFGYPASLLTDFMKGSHATGSIEKIDGEVNPDELIQFLNERLNYLSPHFREWGYLNYSGFGVRGAATAHTLNTITASAVKIGAGFGRKQRCFVVIWMEPDKTTPDSSGMKYYFSTAMRLPWPSKYVCMNKAVPILQAAMEYYLDHYINN